MWTVAHPFALVGASTIDLSKVMDQHDWAVQAKKDADFWFTTALQTHTNYVSALKFNKAAWESNNSLRSFTIDAMEALKFDPSLASPADTALVEKYHDEAMDNLAALVTSRQQIITDMAGHIQLKLPGSDQQSPPSGDFIPRPEPEPTPTEASSFFGTMLFYGAAALVVFFLVPGLGTLLYKKVAS